MKQARDAVAAAQCAQAVANIPHLVKEYIRRKTGQRLGGILSYQETSWDLVGGQTGEKQDAELV
jgi:hypothetical protein